MTRILAFDDRELIQQSIARFSMFTPMHAAVLVAFIVIAAIILAIGWRVRGSPMQRKLERILGWTGLAIWLIANGYGFLPGELDWARSLPIHVCDLAALAGPLVLLRERPPAWLRAWLYFAGIGLCTQAFITPTLEEGPREPAFWFFWSGHFIILICALYDVLVRRWRPTWREWRIAIALSLGYLFVVLPLNLRAGWNYAYIGPEVRDGTLIEVLGPWPWRVVVIVGLVVAAYAALMLPWVLATMRARRV